MRAKVAFRRRVRFGVNIDGVVRTCLQTRFAADALVGVKFDDAIGALVHRRRWTNADTGWILALVAARHLKMTTRIGKLALFNVLDPRAKNAEGDLIFFFACDTARVATDALAIVNE